MVSEKAPDARRANPMVGATRRVARYRAARRTAPTFRNDEGKAQRRRWTFSETIKLQKAGDRPKAFSLREV